jgi:lipopolysaccharide export system protein LptA
MSKSPPISALLIVATTLALTVAAGTVPANAADTAAPGEPVAAAEPIQVTADRLVSNSGESYAEFLGSVEAVQGEFVIHSDKLRIYYRGGAKSDKTTSGVEDALERIVASGNVRIRMGGRTAETERAEYTVSDGVLVMTGEGSVVSDGKNTIRGSTIRLNRNDGQISVEADQGGRVKAVFYSEGKLQPKGGADGSSGAPIDKR